LAIILEEPTKTWITGAFFLIISNLLAKVNFKNYLLDNWLYVKLNDNWQYLFHYTIPWDKIYLNATVLCIYTIITMAIGILIFNKKDVG
jgi:ABC-2 type transport system permease protein